jgi:hypothetical protein
VIAISLREKFKELDQRATIITSGEVALVEELAIIGQIIKCTVQV